MKKLNKKAAVTIIAAALLVSAGALYIRYDQQPKSLNSVLVIAERIEKNEYDR